MIDLSKYSEINSFSEGKHNFFPTSSMVKISIIYLFYYFLIVVDRLLLLLKPPCTTNALSVKLNISKRLRNYYAKLIFLFVSVMQEEPRGPEFLCEGR